MKSIRLADNLTLPISAVTDTFAFTGTRGSGKTYSAGKLVEELHDAGAQVVVLDPVGVWYGLRVAADGRGRGLDVPVFGGIHGDVPLEPTAGELVAELIVEKRVSVVLDVSMFTLGQQHRFVTAFATKLFDLKKSSRSPLHLVIDEAHEFLPQFVGGSEAEMVGAVRRLWKMGRNFGIGGTLISPRPAELNKGSLNLTERMFCGKLKGPQDRKAIEAWAKDQDADVSVLAELPNLKSGDLIHWTEKGPERVRFFKKRTFDASKTPEAGDAKLAKALPAIDLDAVREAMAATIEEAKANDPRALKARIAELERTIASKPPLVTTKPPREVEVLTPAALQRLERVLDKLVVGEEKFGKALVNIDKQRDRLAQAQQVIVSEIGSVRATIAKASGSNGAPRPAFVDPGRGPRQARVVVDDTQGIRRVRSPERTLPDGSALSRCARALLGVLAVRGTATDSQISALSGYRKTSSSFANGLSELRTKGLIDGTPDRRTITSPGRDVAGPQEPLPTGPALLDYWKRRLSRAESTMLDVIFYRNTIGREELSGCSGYSITSSSFANALSGLRTLDLIEGPPGGDVTIAGVFKE